jgi:predicted nucleic acid-binding protein
MKNDEAEAILARVNALATKRVRQVQALRKQLKKADSRATAAALEREIDTQASALDVLKIQQKALKRGIIPDELKDGEAA